MRLPRVLVLCGLGNCMPAKRQRLCEHLALADVTEGKFKGDSREYLTEVVFAPAQVRSGDVVANDLDSALHAVAKGWEGETTHTWALVLLGLSYNCGRIDQDRGIPVEVDQEFGLRILEGLAQRWPDSRYRGKTAIPVVALETFPYGELDAALSSRGNQAYFRLWQEDFERLSMGSFEDREILADHLSRHGLIEGTHFPTVEDSASGRIRWFAESVPIIGRSRTLLYALREARVAAKGESPCLILGPAGSGKELFARYIHQHSTRCQNTYLPYNCAGVAESLLVSELFGIGEKVATDVKASKGVFREAHKGTLFLDEVGDMSSRAQAMVLRATQLGEIQPSGEKPEQVDVRIIAATNKDLEAMARNGEFRHDLLARLNGFVIHVPPLKDRLEDIPLLFEFFLQREVDKDRRLGPVWIDDEYWGSPPWIEDEVYKVLRERRWDDNVRELEQLARGIASRRKDALYIVPSDIPQERSSSAQEASSQPIPPTGRPVGLDEALGRLSLGEVDELRGALGRIQAVHGGLLERVLSKALDAKRNHTCRKPHPVYGDLVPTSALKLLLNNPRLSGSQAKREFRRLGKMLAEQPPADSDLGKVLVWAAGGEKSERARSKKAKKKTDGHQ